VVLGQDRAEAEVVEQEELEQTQTQVRAVSEQLPIVLIYWLLDMEQHLLCLLHLTQLYQAVLLILLLVEVVLLLQDLDPVDLVV
jgi:hypothetical protein